MSDEELTALEVLGYTETNFGRTEIEVPDAMTIPWHELTTCVCDSERDAAKALGFTKVSWDNWSGEEPQPASLEKRWDELTDEEREGAKKTGLDANDLGHPTARRVRIVLE